jgi:hypothetical protein
VARLILTLSPSEANKPKSTATKTGLVKEVCIQNPDCYRDFQQQSLKERVAIDGGSFENTLHRQSIKKLDERGQPESRPSERKQGTQSCTGRN